MARDSLASLPLTAEVYQAWVARTQPPSGGYRLDRLIQALPGWVESAERARRSRTEGVPRRVLVLGYLSWWLEYGTALASVLAGLGHEVSLATLPYRNWRQPVDQWELRRQSTYLRQSLSPLGSLVELHDLSRTSRTELPLELTRKLDDLSRSDVQYTLQRESLDLEGDTAEAHLYSLRRNRNRSAAAAVLGLLHEHPCDVFVVPNGSILEFGAVFQAALHAGVPVTTFEFGEQRERMWIAQNEQVMLQNTDELWRAAAALELADEQQADLDMLLAARSGGRRWSNFARRWQPGGQRGGDATRRELGLDDRPAALLCTNVLGDSLALDRQLFTDGMADWLLATARYFVGHPDVQLIVRVHPGELLGTGLPSVEIVRQALPDLPEHVRVVPPESKINTYDLIELADFGLVYTTTVGLEMALSGLPVVVAGRTHYAHKGFTLDPSSRDQYFSTLDELLQQPGSGAPNSQQIELARRYAYRFFFDYPFRFPWHLIRFWDDIADRPPGEVLRSADLDQYRPALDALLGRPIDWGQRLEMEVSRAG